MPKYVASRTFTAPLDWNATLIEGELEQAIPALKRQHQGNLVVSGTGELAHVLTRLGLIDEFWIHPHLWASGPCVFDGVGPVRLELVAATSYRSGVVWLRYRPADG
jgi:dihydrofolate reductase